MYCSVVGNLKVIIGNHILPTQFYYNDRQSVPLAV